MKLRLALAALAIATAAHAQAPAAPPALTTKPVKPGLYMVTGAGGNVAIRTAPGGVIVVDTKNPGQPIYEALMAEVRKVSPQPVKYVIDTHHHQDHTGNNARFIAAGVPVIGQERIDVGLDTYKPSAANPNVARPASPTQKFARDLTVSVGSAKAELHYYGVGHTGADAFVYFPDIKAIAMGDEMNGGSPTFDFPNGGTVDGWVANLDQALKLDWDVAIPGHGDNAMSRAEVIAFQGKMKDFIARARAAVKAGATRDQLLAAMKIEELGWNTNAAFWNQVPARLDGLWAQAQK